MSDINRALPKELRETVARISYKKSDVNGLYWRVNLLRNKSAHSSKGAYTTYNDKCARYMSFSSRIFQIVYNDSRFLFNTTLFDLNEGFLSLSLVMLEYIENQLMIFEKAVGN